MVALKNCPFCDANMGDEDAEHKPDCYFTLHKALVNSPKGDLSLTPEVLRAWNRRAPVEQAPEGHVLVKRSAIEYANHIADCAERVAASINAVDAAFAEMDDSPDEDSYNKADAKHERALICRNELVHGLGVAIYEYRKRIAAPSAPGREEAASAAGNGGGE